MSTSRSAAERQARRLEREARRLEQWAQEAEDSQDVGRGARAQARRLGAIELRALAADLRAPDQSR